MPRFLFEDLMNEIRMLATVLSDYLRDIPVAEGFLQYCNQISKIYTFWYYEKNKENEKNNDALPGELITSIRANF